MTLKVIVVSTRPGRQGRAIGDWFADLASQQKGFEKVELVDLVDINLPLFDEPNHPMQSEYVHEHTKQWSKIVDEADAFVLILPEYNYFVPPSIVNAIDYLHHEWKYKAASIVSYGGVSGGTRSAQSIKPLLTSVGVMPIPQGVFLPFSKEFIAEDGGKFQANESHEQAAGRMLEELQKWANVLKPLHSS